MPDAAAIVPAGSVAVGSAMAGPAFSGVVDHLGLSVTDLDRSEDFYTSVLGLLRLADFGHARILVHRPTSFMLALVRHEGGDPGAFTELHTGLDHVGFSVGSRDELVRWQHRLEELGVEHTPVRDMEFGHHLNFRDPDRIALELSASNDIALGWLAELRDREIPREEIDARLGDYLASLAPT
ncbi:VOC family protein [Nocardioides terrigena]|uniref:VOC family protein n=1 Tax=Nocardioides terrigena TaxID=424797 RepID=UPI00131EF9D0|nr:VOC family protein [Nocardioides terrigena]